MGIDHQQNTAAGSTRSGVRSMLGALLVCASVGASVFCAAGAQAADMGEGQHRDEARGGGSRDMSSGRGPDNRGGDPRQLDPRSYEARAEEQRRAMQEAGRNAEMNRRAGRLTPDERRDLRRQINEVGQDIYANPPRR